MDKKLLKFIAKAKKQTYASETSKEKKTKDGGKHYIVKQGDYTYTDIYFGNLVDCGQERVYYKGKIIWLMVYRGGMCKGFEDFSKPAFTFLKKCMRKIPKNFPARGPKKLTQGKFRYENIWKGNIKGFVGEENIYYNNKQVCFRNYIGGLVKNKR